MEEKITLVKKAQAEIGMIKKIRIGDPMYFEDGDAITHTYTRSFRGKSNWVAKLEIVENKVTCPPDQYIKEEFEFEDISFRLYLAYDKTMLNLIENNKLYSTQKEKVTELGVDSASYILDVNNVDVVIYTGADGSIGYVCEYYTKNKLDAVAMEITMPAISDDDFERNKKTLEALFNCKLDNIAVEV